jgi:hypothetical protein
LTRNGRPANTPSFGVTALSARLLEAGGPRREAAVEVLDVGDGRIDELERGHLSPVHELPAPFVEPGEISG